MSRRGAVLLVLANAAISLVISIVVVSVALDRWEARQPIYPTLAIPTRATSPTPLTTESVYVVQQGDSLSSIAYRFDVPIDDLMRANDITDPDHITVGRRLIIPAGPVPTVVTTPTHTVLPFEPPTPVVTGTPAVTSTPSPTSAPPSPTLTSTPAPETPTPTPELAAPGIEIQSVLSPGLLPDEALVIVNTGATPVTLEGWTVTDVLEHDYTFGDIVLEPGQSLTLHTGAGEDDADNLYWNLDAALWNSGVTAILMDRDGEVIYELSVE